MPTVFISYSHRDDALRNQLDVHLAMLKREGAIDLWYDHRITPGDDIDAAIEQALDKSDVVLLLCSPDFLASGYCYDREAETAMKMHAAGKARVLPIILRDCEWQRAPFGKLKATPPDGKPIVKWPHIDEALSLVVRDIRAAVSAVPSLDKPSTARESATGREIKPAKAGLPRSGNLSVKREFTDAERDAFRDDTFEFMAKYFEGSLNELARRNPDIKTTFKRIDARSFTAVIYRGGRTVSRCRIALGGGWDANSITYSSTENPHDNSIRGSLSVGDGDQTLFLQPMFGGNDKACLSQEGAAEHYWSMLMERLQR